MAPSCSRDNYLGLLLNYLCAESLVATVDDALEWFVSAVIGHVLLQPGLGGRALAEDLAALPVALELGRSLVAPPLPVTYGMNSLKFFLDIVIQSNSVMTNTVITNKIFSPKSPFTT